LIIKKPDGVVLDLLVRPKKGFFAAAYHRETETLQINLKSAPIKGQANLELERELKKFFQAPVSLVKGLKGKRKQVLIKNKNEKEIRALLESL
jgi:uncharacterized protein (TIGR00251 family)